MRFRITEIAAYLYCGQAFAILIAAACCPFIYVLTLMLSGSLLGSIGLLLLKWESITLHRKLGHHLSNAQRKPNGAAEWRDCPKRAAARHNQI